MIRKLIVASLYAIVMLSSMPAWSADEVTAMRLWHAPDRSRFVLDMDEVAEFKVFSLKHPDRIVIDLSHGQFTGKLPRADNLGKFVNRIRFGYQENNKLRFVFEVSKPVRYHIQQLNPVNDYRYRLVIDLYDRLEATTAATQNTNNRKAVQPSTTTQKSNRGGVIVVAIDPGHGGEDPGALGKHSKEKDVVLKVAKRLNTLINKEKGMRSYLTRSGDYYVGLRKRTRLARKHQADLFISIHADAFTSSRPAGASVYALSQNGATSEEARWLANKENSSDLIGGANISDKDDVVAEVMLAMSMTKTVQESLSFGREVLRELEKIGKLHSRRVEQAGFAVLKSPDIPSILVETAYISNPKDEKALNNSQYQQRLAQAILAGTKRYLKNNRQTYGF